MPVASLLSDFMRRGMPRRQAEVQSDVQCRWVSSYSLTIRQANLASVKTFIFNQPVFSSQALSCSAPK